MVRKPLAVTKRQFVNSAEHEPVANVRIRQGTVEPQALVDLLGRESAAALVDGLGEGIRSGELQAVREAARCLRL